LHQQQQHRRKVDERGTWPLQLQQPLLHLPTQCLDPQDRLYLKRATLFLLLLLAVPQQTVVIESVDMLGCVVESHD
jgi:hypothetical protein